MGAESEHLDTSHYSSFSVPPLLSQSLAAIRHTMSKDADTV